MPIEGRRVTQHNTVNKSTIPRYNTTGILVLTWQLTGIGDSSDRIQPAREAVSTPGCAREEARRKLVRAALRQGERAKSGSRTGSATVGSGIWDGHCPSVNWFLLTAYYHRVRVAAQTNRRASAALKAV